MLLQGVIPVEIRLITVKPSGLSCTEFVWYTTAKGNTVGSRTTTLLENDWAYIAGFFDGDGSLMVQIKNRRDTATGWRIMFTICFYQDTRHKEPLQWMQQMFGIGYLHDRNDGMTELRINGYGQVKKILEGMQPHIKFKRKQVQYALNILNAIEGKSFPSLSRRVRSRTADWIIKLREANYKAHSYKHSPAAIKSLLTF